MFFIYTSARNRKRWTFELERITLEPQKHVDDNKQAAVASLICEDKSIEKKNDYLYVQIYID